MKLIQWYPGHMAKAMRLMEENLSLCDAVIMVLDARAPASTYNPKLRELTGKPVLYLFNKSDLADRRCDELFSAVKKSGKQVLKCNAVGGRSNEILACMEELVKDKAERLKEKGSLKPLRFLVTGVPNTGKSALINLICGYKKAATADRAGVTKNKQWVKCGPFELMDTPGVMPPSFTHQDLAVRLAYLGSLNDDILCLDEIALALLEEMAKKYPDRLKERYGIEGGSPLDMLDEVCKRRGFLLGKGELDYDRGERAVIDDYRKGRLGKTCLDDLDDLQKAGLLS